MAKIIIDPLSRIEGHMSIELDVQKGKVVSAKSKGDMFRGFEMLLKGRNPLDAMQITQRICGVCPISHGMASAKSLDDAFGIIPNKNGRLLRNLALAANYMQSHILHFYHLTALDYVDITAVLKYNGKDKKLNKLKAWAKQELAIKKDSTAVSPFLPRFESDSYVKDQDLNMGAIAHYVEALDIRMKAHKMVALFAGKAPHAMGIVPGGMTQVPTSSLVKQFEELLIDVDRFINKVYIPDVLAIAGAYTDYFSIGKFSNFLSYGVFEEADGDKYGKEFMLSKGIFLNGKAGNMDTALITESVKYGRYSSGSNLHPSKGDTIPHPHKKGAYTWLKAPRYDKKPFEVGPLARTVISYADGNKAVKSEVDAVLKKFEAKLPAVFSVLGRHAARAIESKLVAAKAKEWLSQLDIDKKPRNTFDIPDKGEGMGITEAPRGALGHWITVKDKKIANYQCVVPTTWFASPKDDMGIMGPIEQALIGTKIADVKNPIEAARIVRSFDPCLACAIHLVEGDKEIGSFKVS
jgi:Ni,Fe-hydrogenase I large subunit